MKRADSILANFYMSKKRPVEDPRGQWDHPGEVTRIPSNKITMQGVPYPVLGVGSNGKKQMMYPGEDYTFNGAKYVDEYPVMKSGGGLLSRSVTCSNCGHSWKATDGGIDPLTCHKCGGMIKMKQGGQTKNERDMVNGIADILSQVTDPQNRAQIAKEMVKDFNNEDVTYDYDKFMELSNLKNGGEMIRRADGSYSRRGLWDNIRANKGSGKKPTKEMLEQERKIRRSMQVGGELYWGSNYNPYVWADDQQLRDLYGDTPKEESELDYRELPTVNVTGRRNYDTLPTAIVKGKLPAKKYDTLPTATVVGRPRFIPPVASRDNTAAPFQLPNGKWVNGSNLGMTQKDLKKYMSLGIAEFPINELEITVDALGLLPGPVGDYADIAGSLIDGYQAYDAFSKKDYTEGIVNTLSAAVPLIREDDWRTVANTVATGYDLYKMFADREKRKLPLNPKKQVGGNIRQAQVGKEIKLGPIPYRERYMGMPVDNTFVAPPVGAFKIPTTDVEKYAAKKARETPAQILPANKPRSAAAQAWVENAYPMTALRYRMRGQQIPNNFEKGEINPLDQALAVINPFRWAHDFSNTGDDLVQGNYGQAAFDAASVLPFLSEAKAVAPGLRLLGQDARAAGKYLTTETPLKNTYKLNPWAFKANPESYYRGIARSGLDDALESGVLRTPKGSKYGNDLYLSDKFSEAEYYADNKLPWTILDDGKVVSDLVKGKGIDTNKYIAEIPKAKVNAKSYYINNSQFITNDKIPLNDVRLLKQDWLRRYKEIPKTATKLSGKTLNSFGLKKDIEVYKPPFWDLTPEQKDILQEETLKNINRDSQTFSSSPYNKAKVEKFRPGKDITLSNNEVLFFEDPNTEIAYKNFVGPNTSEYPATVKDWVSSNALGTAGVQYTKGNNLKELTLVKKNNNLGSSYNPKVPPEKLYKTGMHEATHSRIFRTEPTNEENEIIEEAWKPMLNNYKFKNKEDALHEMYSTQNELRTGILKDLTGERVYTKKDEADIRHSLGKLLKQSPNAYISGLKSTDFDIKAIVNSLNKIGLASTIPTAVGTAAMQQKQMGGFVPKYQSKGKVTPSPVYDNIPSPALLNSETLKNINFKKERDQRLLKKRQDVYKTIRPSNYDDINNYFRYLFNNQREDMDDPRSEEAFRMYLNLEKNPKYFSKSKYAPTIKGVPGSTYYKVDDELEQDIFNTYSDKVKLNQVLPAYEEAVESYYSEETPGVFRDVPGGKQYIALQPGDENIIFGRPQASRARALGNFVVSKGKDKKGEYLSYSDQYDFPDFFQNEMQGKPFKIYNRIYYPKEQMGGKVAMREYPTMKYGGFLNKYQEKGQVVMTPVYNSLEDFYQRNKNAKTVINNDQVDILKGLSNDISSGKPVIKYCHPDDEQCTARANRMVQSLIPGTSYFENPDVTSKHLGAGYSVARTPTEQEVKKYPYFKGDTQFGSFDAWDIAPTAEVSKPKNVLFNAGKGKTSFEDFQNKRLSFNKLMESYDVPIGSYINTGYKQIDDTTHSGSHTVRVVGYLPTGEPLVADYGFIKPLSESMYTFGNKDEPFIAAITTVPGKEKYNFKYFKDQKELANKPSDVKYITDFSDKSEDYKKFHDTIAKDKNYVVANLGISPEQYDEYAKLALTLGGHETEFGKGTTYKWLDWLGDSTGVAQLNESNVDEKYKKTLSKYKKGSKEYNALATVLYMNELNKYKDKWFNKGKVAQERPYKRHEIDSRVKELYRNVAQGKSSAGYINSAMDSDEYRDEKGTLELPYKTPFQSDESYKKEVNAFLAKSRPDLRFDYDNKGERVIYKKTQGNKIPNTLKDFVFYAYNTPTTVMYGDAQGDSKYYQKMNEIYTDLFGKKRDGGDISIPELYHVKNPRIKKLF